MPIPVLSPGHASPLTFPPIGRLPSAISAAGFHQFCSRHRRYYAAVRLLTSSATVSSPRLSVVTQIRQSGLGEMRSPRFRRVPFIRNGVSDHGRAVAPRISVRNVLPSTISSVSASATLNLSRLNIPLRMIAVYASRPPSPTSTQHSLQGGALLPYPRRTSTGWTTPASPGARRGRETGLPVPPHRSRRAAFPHRAPIKGRTRSRLWTPLIRRFADSVTCRSRY